jgi:hypothetical protein
MARVDSEALIQAALFSENHGRNRTSKLLLVSGLDTTFG